MDSEQQPTKLPLDIAAKTLPLDIDSAEWFTQTRHNNRRVFAAWLHELTRKIKLSDRKLARLMRIKCGSRYYVHVNSVFYWRTGKRIPPPHMVTLMCETMKLPAHLTRQLHVEAARDYGYLIAEGGLDGGAESAAGGEDSRAATG